MKKMYKYILIITLMMFGFVGEVRGGTIEECSATGHDCKSICYYEEKIDDNKIKKYRILYNYSTEQYQFGIDGLSRGIISTKDSFPITNNGYISQTDLDEIINNNKCPKNIYFSEGTPDKYCFDNASDINNGYCVSQDKRNLFESEEKTKAVLIETTTPDITGEDYLNSCVKKGTCKTLCSYSYGYSDFAYIYYFKDEDQFKASFSWKDKNDVYKINEDKGTAFMGPVDFGNLREAICPNNVYKDLNNSKEVCFDSDGKYCEEKLSGHFSDDELLKNAKVDTLLTKKQLKKLFPEDKKLMCDAAQKKIISSYKFENGISEICVYSKDDTKNPDANQFFIVVEDNKYRYFHYSNINSIESLVEITDSSKVSNFSYSKTLTCTAYPEVYSSVTYYPSTDKYGNQTLTSYSWWDDDKNALAYDYKYSQSCTNGTIPGVEYKYVTNHNDCESLLGTDLVNELNSYLLYIKIAVPIIIIVMGSIDFLRAFIASDEDAMKKAQKRFIMRLIIGMVIFFIPTIINALLNVADQVWNITNGNGTCGIGF